MTQKSGAVFRPYTIDYLMRTLRFDFLVIKRETTFQYTMVAMVGVTEVSTWCLVGQTLQLFSEQKEQN